MPAKASIRGVTRIAVLSASLVFTAVAHAAGVPYQLKELVLPIDAHPPEELTAVGSSLFFVAGTDIGPALWRSDGTPDGTTVLKRFSGGSASPSSLTDVNGMLMLSAAGETGGHELWRSNGTAQGTALVKDIDPFTSSNPSELGAANGLLYFSARHVLWGIEPWISDGTEAGTRLLRDVQAGDDSSYPRAFVRHPGGAVYFSASGQLWRTDGTTDGTVPVPVTYAGTPLPTSLTAGTQRVFFVIETGQVCWVADGGPAPCAPVVHDGGGAMVVAGDTAFNVSLGGLYRTDPTTATTSLVANVASGELAVLDAFVYFVGEDERHGRELWRTDGSPAGTRMVADLLPGPEGAAPRELVTDGERLYFVVDDEEGHDRLAQSDGTSEGTRLFPLFAPDPSADDTVSLTVVGSTLLFFTENFPSYRLWALPPCGNARIEPGEECDDGNQRDGDCCPSTCRDASPAGAACDDGDPCTAPGHCDPAGTCIDQAVAECTDGLVCTMDDCRVGVGCVHTPWDRSAVEEIFARGLLSEDCLRAPRGVAKAFRRAGRRALRSADPRFTARDFRRAAAILDRTVRKLDRGRSGSACRGRFRARLAEASLRLRCVSGGPF